MCKEEDYKKWIILIDRVDMSQGNVSLMCCLRLKGIRGSLATTDISKRPLRNVWQYMFLTLSNTLYSKNSKYTVQTEFMSCLI